MKQHDKPNFPLDFPMPGTFNVMQINTLLLLLRLFRMLMEKTNIIFFSFTYSSIFIIIMIIVPI